MKIETLKKIAERAYPDAECVAIKNGKVVVYWTDDITTFNTAFASTELHLIRMYREWLIATPLVASKLAPETKLRDALESTEALLEAIERDML
jgi:hypothetical protein